MKRLSLTALVAAVVTLLGFSTAQATTTITSNITTSTTWTKAAGPYALKGQIFVKNNATLTIEAGTVIASFVDDQGSLGVCKGAKLYANGTAADPVIFTSADDVATWTGNVTSTAGGIGSGHITTITSVGNWRAPIAGDRHLCNEWGCITMMGKAYIGQSQQYSNSPNITGTNIAQMEGLSTTSNDPNTDIQYGGNDDNDCSGGLHYVQLRYGGKVASFNNELNGLSMGGIGRNTQVDHIEVFENIDDGIETWGGTVNYKYVITWQIGDDNFDFDQGWRGKLQFGFFVQGWSLNGPAGSHQTSNKQGSGIGDNIFEMDGAEDSDAFPQSAACIYNVTGIGQRTVQGGDQAMAWRDNAHAQFRRCFFMDVGEQAVALDFSDGDSSQGYGYNGTLSWADCWTTPYSAMWDRSNTGAGGHANLNGQTSAFLSTLYKAQTDGNLCEVKDSVFYNCDYTSASRNLGAINIWRVNTDGTTAANANLTGTILTLNRTGTAGAPTYTIDTASTSGLSVIQLANYITANCVGWRASPVAATPVAASTLIAGSSADCLTVDKKLGINAPQTVGAFDELVRVTGALGAGTTNNNRSATDNGAYTAGVLPIGAIVRNTSVYVYGSGSSGTIMSDISSVDPRPAAGAGGDILVDSSSNPIVHGVGFDPPADGFFTNAPFRGAFSRDVNWAKGWTNIDACGKFPTSANPADPSATGSMPNVTTRTSFPTVAGAIYTVEKSSDMKTWAPVTTVIGTGSTMTVDDTDTFDNAKFYRAVRQ
jgi:hypothetical protein